MQNRFEDLVTLPSAVFAGLEAVQGLRQVSMEDHQTVQKIAAHLGYLETSRWIEDHQHEYHEGLFRKFVATE
jgi:hypothetical protein